MAATELTQLILKVQERVKDSSDIYRHFVSDKRAHFVTLNEQQMVEDVKKAAQAALGRSKIDQLPTEIESLINTETTKMFGNYVKALHPDRFLSKRRKFETSEYNVTGADGDRELTVVFGLKSGKKPTSVFNAFKRVKQAAQRTLLKNLNSKLKEAGAKERQVTSKRTGKTRTLQPIDKNEFLDIGHMGASAVQQQRRRDAQNLIINGYETTTNPIVKKYIEQLAGSAQFVLDRQPRPEKGGKEVSEVGIEFSGENRKALDVPGMARDLEADLEAALAQFSDLFATDPGSPSFIDTVIQDVDNGFAKLPGKKTNIKRRSTKRKRKKIKATRQKPKASKGEAFVDNTKTAAVQAGVRESRKQSPINLMSLINSKLPQTVRKNMGFPRLENQTGTFAASVRVTDASMTAQGFPSIGYTYQRQPYGVFEASSGTRFASPERDPRTLITQSIREIAAEIVTGRLYTRRV